MSIVNVRIPDELRRELHALAGSQNRPASEIVRDALRQYIACQRFQTLRSKTLPFAEAQGLLIDDEVFAALS
jgi:predicted transcriptional regulator